MELTTAQRKIAFAVIVLALLGLGWWLLWSAGHGTAAAGLARPAQRPVGAPAAARPAPVGFSPAGSASAVTAPPPAAGRPDIYQWLPFSRAELGAAARTVVNFAGAYGTFSYAESAAGYLASMRGLVTGQLNQLLAQAYTAPGVASMRASRKQVADGTAQISSLRAFGPGSLTFVVAITQRITDAGGVSRSTTDYAVTMTGAGPSWLVSDIELASAGNS